MSDQDKRPVFAVLAGPHGAGKSTLYDKELRHEAAIGERVASTDAARIAALMADRKPVTVESTMTNRQDVDLVRAAKAAGYQVQVFHVSVAGVDAAVDRANARAAAGGHRIAEPAIRDSYEAGIANIRTAASLADKAQVYDNSKPDQPLRLSLELNRGQVVSEANPALWTRLAYSAELQRERAEPAPALQAFVATQQFALAEPGQRAEVNAVSSDRASFEGKVIARTPTHTIQQVGPNNTVAHVTGRLGTAPEIGDSVLIQYEGKGAAQTMQRVDADRAGGRLAYEPYQAKPAREGEPSPMSLARAESFRKDNPLDAIKKFPELTKAYDVLIAVKKSIPAENKEAAGKLLVSMRNKLADKIERNEQLPAPVAAKAKAAPEPERSR